jgi:hypothetical protein
VESHGIKRLINSQMMFRRFWQRVGREFLEREERRIERGEYAGVRG